MKKEHYLDMSINGCCAYSTHGCSRYWSGWSWRRWGWSGGWTWRSWSRSRWRRWCGNGCFWRRWRGSSFCFSGRWLSADCTRLDFEQLLTGLHCITILYENLFDYTGHRSWHTDSCLICFNFHHILVNLNFITNLTREPVIKDTD